MSMEKTILKIAQKHLDLDSLETVNSGADFREHAVWCIKAALEHAYKAGAMNHSDKIFNQIFEEHEKLEREYLKASK